MRYHIHRGMDLKFCMDIDIVYSNKHEKYFYSRSTNHETRVIYFWQLQEQSSGLGVI